jgi:TPR repeat protein
MMYFEGDGVEKNSATAMQYFSMAAHQGHTQALYHLGQIHINGIGTLKSCSIGVKVDLCL